jgi:hypothetical protein
MRTSMRWAVGLSAALGLVACHESAPIPDTSAMTAGMSGRWVSQSAAWKDRNIGHSSYDGTAFGPGKAEPIERPTLNNPEPGVDYVATMVPAEDFPQLGEPAPAGEQEIPTVVAPSDDYFVGGRDMGPSVDRAPGTGGPAKMSSPQP